MKFKKIAAVLIAAAMVFSFAACGSTTQKAPTPLPPQENPGEIVLEVYAPNETLTIMSTLAYIYKGINPDVSIKIVYDEGAVLAAKLEGGYQADIYIADEPMFMDWLDAEIGENGNPNKNDKIVHSTRTEIAVGPGNESYSEEDIPEGETYITNYSAAKCRTTVHDYEAEKFIAFLASEDARETYEAYGFAMAGETPVPVE